MSGSKLTQKTGKSDLYLTNREATRKVDHGQMKSLFVYD